MAHSITFDKTFSGFVLSEDEVRDFIEMFYRWEDSKFLICRDEKERKFRGQHSQDWSGTHIITLVEKNIKRDFDAKKRTGGNFVAPSLKIAAGMVLAHELQHANQTKLHKHETTFYGKAGGMTPTGKPRMKQYWGRACEREAREFVDNKMPEICAYFQTPWEGRGGPTIGNHGDANREAAAVAELLQECSEVTMEDVKEELRASKILNPRNVIFVVEELKRNGVDII